MKEEVTVHLCKICRELDVFHLGHLLAVTLDKQLSLSVLLGSPKCETEILTR